MADAVSVDVSSYREMAVRLRGQLTDAIATKVGAVHRKVAADVERTMKAISPVDTGALRASESTVTTGDPHTTITSEIGPTIDYAIYLELGTSRMSPRPYMRPAVEAHEDAYYAGLEGAVADGLGG